MRMQYMASYIEINTRASVSYWFYDTSASKVNVSQTVARYTYTLEARVSFNQYDTLASVLISLSDNDGTVIMEIHSKLASSI